MRPLLLLLALLCMAPAAYAWPEHTIATGEDVHVTENPAGDVLAGGWNVQFDAEDFPHDIFGLAADVNVRGNVKAGAWLFAQNAEVSGKVNGGIAAAGQTVTIARGAVVKKTVWLAGQKVVIHGIIPAQGRILANRVVLDGHITGEGKGLEIQTQELEVLPTARIDGKVVYRGKGSMRIDKGAIMLQPIERIEQTYADELKTRMQKVLAISALGGKLMLVIWLLVAGVIVSLGMTAKMRGALRRVREKPWRLLAMGLAYLIAVPVGAVVLFASVIGIPVAISMLAAYPITIVTAFAIGILWLGSLIFEVAARRRPQKRYEMLICYLVGLPIVLVVTRIPFVGVLGWLVPLMAGLGGLAWLKWRQMEAGKE